MSKKGLQILAKKGLRSNIKGKSLKPFIDCLAGKQYRVAFYESVQSQEETTFLFWFIVRYAL